MTDMKMQDVKLTDKFAGHLQGVKFQDMKMTDQVAGHENAKHEIAGQKIPCYQRLHYVAVCNLWLFLFLDTNTLMHCA